MASSNCFPPPYWTYTMCLTTLLCYPWAYNITLTQLYPTYFLAQNLEVWGTCGVKMMWLCHVWGWESPQTASHIHIKQAWSIWPHWYTVHWHMVAALHSYIHLTWCRIFGSWSLVESKWCDYVMVEVDGHLKLLPTSILDIYNVFEHIDMLSMGIQYHPYKVMPNLILGSEFGVLGALVESKWCDYVMVEADGHLKLLLTSILNKLKVFEHIDMLSIGIW